MRKFEAPRDDRVKLPKMVQHIIFFIFGISGVMMMNKTPQMDYTYIDSLVLLCSAVYAGLATYGAFNLVHDIKKHKTLRGIWRNIINKFELTFYDDNRNSN